MWKIVILAIIQSLFLSGGQVFLKFALTKMKPFGWNWNFWSSLLLNWQFAACGVFFIIAALLWFYMIKNFPLSVAYPLGSLSYVFAMFASMFFFNEYISMTRWIGVGLIMAGCCFIAK